MTSVESKNKEYIPENYPSSYREVKIGRTYFYVTSVYTGEKELGPTLEKLAVQRVLEEMDEKAKNIMEPVENL